MMGKSYEEIAQTGAFIRYHYQPLTSIHLHSDLVAELGPNASIQYVWIFTAAAIFVLLIACVNFMNLSTARSALSRHQPFTTRPSRTSPARRYTLTPRP